MRRMQCLIAATLLVLGLFGSARAGFGNEYNIVSTGSKPVDNGCTSGYNLDGFCLSACPTQFYPDSTGTCVECAKSIEGCYACEQDGTTDDAYCLLCGDSSTFDESTDGTCSTGSHDEFLPEVYYCGNGIDPTDLIPDADPTGTSTVDLEVGFPFAFEYSDSYYTVWFCLPSASQPSQSFESTYDYLSAEYEFGSSSALAAYVACRMDDDHFSYNIGVSFCYECDEIILNDQSASTYYSFALCNTCGFTDPFAENALVTYAPNFPVELTGYYDSDTATDSYIRAECVTPPRCGASHYLLSNHDISQYLEQHQNDFVGGVEIGPGHCLSAAECTAIGGFVDSAFDYYVLDSTTALTADEVYDEELTEHELSQSSCTPCNTKLADCAGCSYDRATDEFTCTACSAKSADGISRVYQLIDPANGCVESNYVIPAALLLPNSAATECADGSLSWTGCQAIDPAVVENTITLDMTFTGIPASRINDPAFKAEFETDLSKAIFYGLQEGGDIDREPLDVTFIYPANSGTLVVTAVVRLASTIGLPADTSAPARRLLQSCTGTALECAIIEFAATFGSILTPEDITWSSVCKTSCPPPAPIVPTNFARAGDSTEVDKVGVGVGVGVGLGVPIVAAAIAGTVLAIKSSKKKKSKYDNTGAA